MFAIWMTGSTDASGKTPFLPAHSISKLRIRKGAIFAHSPSGACDMNWSNLTTISTVKIENTRPNVSHTWRRVLFGIATSFLSPWGQSIYPQGFQSSSYLRPTTELDHMADDIRLSHVPLCLSWNAEWMGYCSRKLWQVQRKGLWSSSPPSRKCVKTLKGKEDWCNTSTKLTLISYARYGSWLRDGNPHKWRKITPFIAPQVSFLN